MPDTSSGAPDKTQVGTVTAVRLKNAAGESPREFSCDDALNLELDFALARPAATRLTVDVMSADGRLVFSASHDAGQRSGAGTATLTWPRLALGGGVYEVLVSAAGGGEKITNPFRAALHVAPSEGTGLVRPQLTWSLGT